MFAALAAGYLAKSGYLQDRRTLEDLELRVCGLLPKGSDVRDVVEIFCRSCRNHRLDPKQVAVEGDWLVDRVQSLAMPIPPGSDRADLH